MGEGLSYEDLQKAGASFEDAEPAPMSYEDLYKAGATFHDKPETSIGGAFARGAVEGAAPAVGGLGAGIAAGAAIGSAFAPGIGTGIGAAAGGLAAGMGAGYLISKGQDWVLDKLGLRDDPESMFSNEQRAADEEAHPYARFAGEMAPAAALLRPGGSMLQRGVGAAIGGAATAGTDYLQTGEVDPVKALMGAGFGAALPGTNKLGDKFHAAGEGVGQRSPFAPKPPGTGFTMEGEPYGPDAPSRPMRDVSPGAAGPTRMLEGPQREFNPDVKPEPLDGEILNPDREQSYRDKYADQMQTALEQRDSFDPKQDPELWGFWNDQYIDLRNRANGKGSLNVDASQGPASEENPFTYRDSDRANQTPTSSAGTSLVQTGFTRNVGQGNPVGAPMEARSAQRPTGLLRDYRKTKPDAGTEVATQESTVVSQAPIHEDIAAALQGEQPPAARESVLSAPEPPPREPVAPAPREMPVKAVDENVISQPAPRPEKPVTAEVTPPVDETLAKSRARKIANIERDLHTLDEQGGTDYLARWKRMSPEDQLARIDGMPEPSGSREAQTTESGAMARDKADKARKDATVKVYKDVVDLFPPAEGESDGATRERAKHIVQTVQNAIEDVHKTYPNKNKKPYEPNEKPIELLVYKAAKALVSKQTPAALAEFRAVEKGDAAAAKDFQATKRIKADIDLRPQLSDAAAEARLAQAAPENDFRPEHEAFVNPKGEENAVFTGQKNDLVNWLNGMSDESHAYLLSQNHDLVARVKGTQDPFALHSALRQELAGRRPSLEAEFEAAPAEDMPVTKRTPIKTAADDETFMSKLLGDEGGALDIDKIPEWARGAAQGVRDFFHPQADRSILDYGDQIGAMYTKVRNYITRGKTELYYNAKEAQYEDGSKPTIEELGGMYRAKERGKLGDLPEKQQKYWNTYVQPIIERANRDYDKLRELSIKNKFPGWENMPERKVNGDGFMDYMFRRTKAEDERGDEVDPITNKSSLSNWAQSAQERDWFTLAAKDGERIVYRVNKDGKMVFYKNHTAGSAKTPPASFDPRDIGSTLNIAGKKMTVDHSNIDELMAHGNGEGGKPLQYTDNPLLAASDAASGLRSALLRTRMLDDLISDPKFQGLTTKNSKQADERWGEGNYAQTKLPQLKDRYMPKPLAWALDDIVKTGFDYNGNRMAEAASRLSQAMLKPFYFLGPEVHVFNELDKFLVGRGYDNLNLPRTGRIFMKALKSVRAQDETQKEIIEAGGNPMFAHALTSRLMPNIAKFTGEDMAVRPWKYDPLNKAFGVNTRQIAGDMYQASNKMMWWQSDVLYTALYSEMREKGMDPKAAVHETEKIIDGYVVPTTFGKSIGLEGTDAGRALQKILTDPITGLFGRFHYGLYKTAAGILKNTFGYDSTPQQRVKGASQAAMLIGMANVVYPALSKVYQKITGDDKSEFEKRGITKLATLPGEIASGKHDVSDAARNFWTPAPLLDTGLRQFQNRDFAGRKILDNSGGNKKLPFQEAEFLAGQAVSPIRPVSQALQHDSAKFALQRFLESNFGLKTPSAKAAKYEDHREQNQARDAKQRARNPRGVIEALGN